MSSGQRKSKSSVQEKPDRHDNGEYGINTNPVGFIMTWCILLYQLGFIYPAFAYNSILSGLFQLIYISIYCYILFVTPFKYNGVIVFILWIIQ